MIQDGLWFIRICNKNDFPVSDVQIDLIERFVCALLEWNKKINLVSRRDESNIWSKHILGSVSFLFSVHVHPHSNILDIGTGGGLPGIPLAIVQPSLRVTLIDSIQKKYRAVKDMLSHLQLKNVDALCGRAEKLSKQKKYGHTFDYVIARGVGPIEDVVRWSEPFLKRVGKTGGTFHELNASRSIIPRRSVLLMKGGDLSKEIEEARMKLKPRVIKTYPIMIRGGEESNLTDKKLVVIQP